MKIFVKHRLYYNKYLQNAVNANPRYIMTLSQLGNRIYLLLMVAHKKSGERIYANFARLNNTNDPK